MTTEAVLWLRLRPTLPLLAAASSVTVRYTVVREASSAKETSPLSGTVVSFAAAAPRFPSPPNSLVRGSIASCHTLPPRPSR